MSALVTDQVTRLLRVDRSLAEKLWEIYDATFAPMRRAHPVRQSFKKEQFLEVMGDERFIKFVAWGGDEPLGMMIASNRFDLVDWIEAECYEDKFPEYFANDTLFYIAGWAVRLDAHGQKNGAALVRETGDYVGNACDGMLAWDNSSLLQQFMPAFLTAVGDEIIPEGVELIDLGSQHYYALRPKR